VTVELWLGSITALGLLFCLVAVLVQPERF
jgi:hypothetical protein